MEHRPIPGTLGFLADSEGNIYDQDKVKRNTYRNGDGYVTASVLTEDNQWITFGVHRLVAFAFLDLPRPGFEMINHRDGDVSNNALENLEWVSAEQNAIHAAIMNRNSAKACIGAIEFFKINGLNTGGFGSYSCMNAWDAAEKAKIGVTDVWDSIKDDKEVYGWKFSYRRQADAIPEEFQQERIKDRNEWGQVPERSVKVRDIDTGIITIFPTMAAAGRYFQVSTSHIYQSIPKREVRRIFKKKYQIVYTEWEFPELNEMDIRLAKSSGPKDVVAYNYEKKTLYIFESAAEFIRFSNLSKKAVSTTLFDNRLRKIGDWSALYYENDNVGKLLEYVKGSSPDVTPE